MNRALGCVYGQFIGDALGSRYEFKSGKITRNMLKRDQNNGQIPLLGDGAFGYGPGVVTDDGEMAMSLLSSCIQHGRMNAAHVACCYFRWLKSSPPDIGITCRSALDCNFEPDHIYDAMFKRNGQDRLSPADWEIVHETLLKSVKEHNRVSLSNGSLMRQSVLAAFYACSDSCDELMKAIEEDTNLTHCAHDAISASKIYGRTIYSLIRGKTPREAYEDALNSCDSSLVRSLLMAADKNAVPVTLPDGRTSNGDDVSIGYLGVALQIAFHQLLHCSSFEDGLIAAVSVGGDTDTNGAITAALIGARFGIDDIPDDWKKSVEGAELRLKGENGIKSFEYLIEGVKKRYE